MMNLKNWGVLRMVRFSAGLLILWRSFVDHQPLMGIIGGLLVIQAMMNLGCAGGQCGIRAARKKIDEPVKEIDYEEIH
ncbi:hypothetical protein [Larkinella sp. C7]|uniref:hypothetical protein n=1 Tax=Larkinella sp. C7 TaxID=2576607 RepID=UPI0011115554|nr:hypothetical protein [Larkinella sp. C7]